MVHSLDTPMYNVKKYFMHTISVQSKAVYKFNVMQTQAMELALLPIEFDDEATTYTFPRSLVAIKNTSIETTLKNIATLAFDSDTAHVNYTTGGTNMHTLEPVNELFCDNLILSVPFKTPTPQTPEQITKYAALHLATYTQQVYDFFKDRLGLACKQRVKPTHLQDIGNKGTDWIQYLKVDLANVPSKDVLAFIGDEDAVAALNELGIYIHDIDFTQDFKGVIQKQSVVQHLVNNYNFRVQHEEDCSVSLEEQSREAFNGTVLDNGDLVGNNCLTLMQTHSCGKCRLKFYNKFVQSLESASVRKNLGDNKAHWVNNPEIPLQEAIPKCLDCGLLRLETTFYLEGKTTLSQDDINDVHKQLQSYIPPELLYYNPIQTQFNLFCSMVSANMCLYDVDNKIGLVALHINKDTGKIGGFFLKNSCTQDSASITHYLRHYTWNVPLRIVLLTDVSKEDIKMQYRTYAKLNYKCTCLTIGEEAIKTALTTMGDKQPSMVGMAENSKVNYIVAAKTPSKTTRTDITWRPLEDPYNLAQVLSSDGQTLREFRRGRKEEIRESIALIKNAGVIEEIQNLNEQRQQDYLRLTQASNNRRAVEYLLRNLPRRRFVEDENGHVVGVFAIKIAETVSKQKSALLLCRATPVPKEGDIKEAPGWFVYYATKTIMDALENYLPHLENIAIRDYAASAHVFDNNLPLYVSSKLERLFLIKKEGEYLNAAKNKCASVCIITGSSTFTGIAEMEQKMGSLVRQLSPAYKIRSCSSADVIEEGTKCTITGFRYAGKSLLLEMDVNGQVGVYLATSFLKELAESKHLAVGSCRISVVAGPYKTDKNKKKCRQFYG